MLIDKRERKVPSPAYMRIRQYVMGLINRSGGEAKPILSLREICRTFDVSVPTARKALKTLLKEKCLMTVPGVGTFINPEARVLKGDAPVVGLVFGGGAQVNLGCLGLLSGLFSALDEQFYAVRVIQLTEPTAGPEKLVEEIELYNLSALAWILPRGRGVDVVRLLMAKALPAMMADPFGVYPEDAPLVGSRPGSIETLAADWLLDQGAEDAVYIGPDCPVRAAAFNAAFAARGKRLDEKRFLVDERLAGRVRDVRRAIFDEGARYLYSHGGARLLKLFPLLREAKEKGLGVRVVLPYCEETAKAPELSDAIVRVPAEALGMSLGVALHKMVRKTWAGPRQIFLEPALEINVNNPYHKEVIS